MSPNEGKPQRVASVGAAYHLADAETDTHAPERGTGSADSQGAFWVSVFTNCGGKPLGKRIARGSDGALVKTALANLYDGDVQRRSFASLAEFAEFRAATGADTALAYGICDRAVARVATQKDRERFDNTVVSRDGKHFAFAGGRHGVLMLDYDPLPGAQPLAPDELLEALRLAVPMLRSVTMLWTPSASSCIHDEQTGASISGINGQRVYLLVREARDIPTAGQYIFDRCILAGLGSVKFADDGKVMRRTIVDRSVWQPERLDFVRATCGPGLVQRPEPARTFDAEDMPSDLFGDSALDAKALAPLTDAERDRIADLWREIEARAKPEAEARRGEWARRKAREHATAATAEEIEARAATYLQALTNESLPCHFELIAEDGTAVTVQDLIDDPARFNGRRFADPVEPDGDRRAAVAYLQGRANGRGPAIFSHLHGGRWFDLIDLTGFEDEPTEPPEAAADDELREGQADVELSRRLVPMLVEANILFVHDGPGWVQWRDGVYRRCVIGEPVEVAKRLGQRVARDAAATEDRDKAKRLLRLADRAMIRQGIDAAVHLAKSDPRVAARVEEFDADPDIWNTTNGCIHLPSGTLLPHAPTQRFMKQSPVPFDPQARAPVFEKALRDIACEDLDWIDHLHRLIGYSMSGRVNEEKAVFLVGGGANGKSTICNIVWHIAGDYCVAVPSAFLCQAKDPDPNRPTSSLSALKGARFAFANETELGMKLSAKTLKEVSSADPIATRDNYGKHNYSFKPSHTLWIRGNHKPIIHDTDNGIWRRLDLIPFSRQFKPDEKDIGLDRKLIAEAPGILAWMVRGHSEYLRKAPLGLSPSKRAAAALLTYRSESDLLGLWLSDCCQVDPAGEYPQQEAYSSFQNWCKRQGLMHMSQKSLTISLEERGYAVAQRSKPPRVRVYRGLVPVAGEDVAGEDVAGEDDAFF